MTKCPCAPDRTFETCCEPFLKGERVPRTAEELMRSRYSAFARGEVEYVRETVLPAQQKDVDLEQVKAWSTHSEWLGFELRSIEGGTEQDDRGQVEFVAHYRVQGKDVRHHEFAAFAREDGRWYFDPHESFEPPPEPLAVARTAGRNEPCPCGSGRKYKKCCGS